MEAPHNCPWCGADAWRDPSDIDPPVDYCHEGDHGTPEEWEDEE